jgi:hypothetical protein
VAGLTAAAAAAAAACLTTAAATGVALAAELAAVAPTAFVSLFATTAAAPIILCGVVQDGSNASCLQTPDGLFDLIWSLTCVTHIRASHMPEHHTYMTTR